MRIAARTLLNYTTEQLMDMLTGSFVLVFDDGELTTTYGEALYSRYFWELHRHYPRTPLLTNHHCQKVLKGNLLNNKTHIKLCESVYRDVIRENHLKTPQQKDTAIQLIYEITNNIYNELQEFCQEYMISLDILDFIEVHSLPELNATLAAIQPNPMSLKSAASEAMNTLMTDSRLYNNQLARTVRSNLGNTSQVMQCLVARGYVADVDSKILPRPVLSSYLGGMRNPYEITAESRTGPRAYYFSVTPLQNAEYLARRIQLLTMGVERIHYVDCGSKNYVRWLLMPPTYENGRMNYKGDLPNMTGVHYLKENGELGTLSVEDTHLYGQSLLLRSPLTCSHEDKHGVCAVCFGTLSENFNEIDNVGHKTGATTTQNSSQSILSTKHVDSSSASDPITLNERADAYFTVGPSVTSYYLKRSFCNEETTLAVHSAEIAGLTDLLHTNAANIDPGRISCISTVFITTSVDGGSMTEAVRISQQKRKGLMTIELLDYLKQHSWSVDSKNNYVFSMANWDHTKPIFKVPEKEFSFSHHSEMMGEMIEGRSKNIEVRGVDDTPERILSELFRLANTKLNVHWSLLASIIYAAMVVDDDNCDYPRNTPTQQLGTASKTITGRSLSGAYAYKDQHNTMISAKAFFGENRPDSPFDVCVDPKTVVEYYRTN